jgi:hypothetical protein
VAAAWAYEVGGLGGAVEVGVRRSVSPGSDTD